LIEWAKYQGLALALAMAMAMAVAINWRQFGDGTIRAHCIESGEDKDND
jgi:hypothetical protein